MALPNTTRVVAVAVFECCAATSALAPSIARPNGTIAGHTTSQGPALQAEIHHLGEPLVDRQVAALHRSHCRQPAAGRCSFVTGEAVRWTLRQAQTALDTGVELDLRRRPLGDPGHHTPPGRMPGLQIPAGSNRCLISRCNPTESGAAPHVPNSVRRSARSGLDHQRAAYRLGPGSRGREPVGGKALIANLDQPHAVLGDPAAGSEVLSPGHSVGDQPRRHPEAEAERVGVRSRPIEGVGHLAVEGLCLCLHLFRHTTEVERPGSIHTQASGPEHGQGSICREPRSFRCFDDDGCRRYRFRPQLEQHWTNHPEAPE